VKRSGYALWGAVGFALGVGYKIWVDTGFDFLEINSEPVGAVVLYGVIGAAAGLLLCSFL
jgi:hypothetical protein